MERPETDETRAVRAEEMTEFEQFWAKFPRRTAKLAAMRAFQKARKLASLNEILAGIETYIVNKPDYADFCHPATFLNSGRWMDEPDVKTETKQRQNWGFDCQHTPLCRNHWDCVQKRKVG